MTARTRNRVDGVPPNPGAGLAMDVTDGYTAGRVPPVAFGVIVPDPDSLMALLAAERRQAGMSQRALAARLGSSRSAVQKWEGRLMEPGVSSLLAFVGAVRCDLALVPRGGGRG